MFTSRLSITNSEPEANFRDVAGARFLRLRKTAFVARVARWTQSKLAVGMKNMRANQVSENAAYHQVSWKVVASREAGGGNGSGRAVGE